MRDPTGQAWPVDSGTLALATLPTSPFLARRYTRLFLDSCQEISLDTAETAELIVSELVTNAVRYAGEPAGIALWRKHNPCRCAERLTMKQEESVSRVPTTLVTISTAGNVVPPPPVSVTSCTIARLSVFQALISGPSRTGKKRKKPSGGTIW